MSLWEVQWQWGVVASNDVITSCSFWLWYGSDQTQTAGTRQLIHVHGMGLFELRNDFCADYLFWIHCQTLPFSLQSTWHHNYNTRMTPVCKYNLLVCDQVGHAELILNVWTVNGSNERLTQVKLVDLCRQDTIIDMTRWGQSYLEVNLHELVH